MTTRRRFVKQSAITLMTPLIVPGGLVNLVQTDFAAAEGANTTPKILLDMVHHNPGMAPTVSQFSDPRYLKTLGYDGKVFFLFEAAHFGVDWQTFDAEIFPSDSAGSQWVNQKREAITKAYTDAKAAGLQVYCMLDMLVLPQSLIKKYKADLCQANGKIDISKPFTQKAVRYLLNAMFAGFTQLDGLVIRTGETYLHDAPYHAGGSPVVNGLADHVTLINLLRDVVCQQHHKKLFYRTWDTGKLHSLPKYYLEVSNAVEPHPNLYFSIKHTMVDFWRMAVDQKHPDYNTFDNYWIDEASQYGIPFNPCLGIGRHRQIVEVQCQREYEGKAAHPNYIAEGVINRFKELKTLPGVQCLSEFKSNPLYAGVWTWSRGGGWGGPYVKNEIWPELNAFVLGNWTKHPELTEKEIFGQFCKFKGIPPKEVHDFHQLCLLSGDAILKGQYSAYGHVYVNWTRDDSVYGWPYLQSYIGRMVAEGKIDDYLQEKQEACALWQQIEKLAQQVTFAKPDDTQFVRASCTYGRLKFDFFKAAWEVMLIAYRQKQSARIDKPQLTMLIGQYDQAWQAWHQFATTNTYSPTLYQTRADFYGNPIGVAQTVDEIRKMVV